MHTLPLLSAHLLFLLLILYISIHLKFNYLMMFNNFSLTITHIIKSVCDLLFNRKATHHVPEEKHGKKLSVMIRRYEGGEVAPECAVCLCKIEEGDEIRELRCEHLFHRGCLDRWVGYSHLTCPLCRGSLGPRKRAADLGEEELFFNFCSFRSSHRSSWWLR